MIEYCRHKDISFRVDYDDYSDKWEWSFSEIAYHNDKSGYVSDRGYTSTKSEAKKAAEEAIERELDRMH